MNFSCVGFYLIKSSSSSFKKETSENQWINANISINAEIDRYILEIKHVGMDDDIYDEDEDDKCLKITKKIRLNDYKSCEPRGCQKIKTNVIYVLILFPKLFSKAKKTLLAFPSEEVQMQWFKHLQIILMHKFQNNNGNNSAQILPDSTSTSSIENYMIDNDLYEGSGLPGEFIATVIESEKSKQIGLKGQYIMTISDTGLELREESAYEVVTVWEIKNIRKYGEKDNVFFMELGNHCKEGPGFLSFKMTQAKTFMKQLLRCKEECLKKQDSRNSIIKKVDNSNIPEKRLTSIDETYRESVLMTMVKNLTYNDEDFPLSPMEEKRVSPFEPPKVAPPPIPPIVPDVPLN